MNFLEAHKIVTGFAGGPTLRFLFAISGTPDKVDLFFKAAGAKRGRTVDFWTLPFNTLGQALLSDAGSDREVFVLFPWDLVPEADWRSGFPTATLDFGALQARAQQTIDRLTRRANARLLYVPAPMPPLFADPATTSRLDGWLTAATQGAGARLLPSRVFSLASYLSTGSPFASGELGLIAETVIDNAIGEPPQPKKVLITDLDNVMWRGVIGEDGLDGIHFSSEGVGFRHFVYQTLLAKLKREGALLAAVFCVGLGLPFVLVALGLQRSRTALGWLRRHRLAVQRTGGVLLVALGLALLTGVWTTWAGWLQGLLTGADPFVPVL